MTKPLQTCSIYIHSVTSPAKCFLDIDECNMGLGPCGQVCTNTPGSFECSCTAGYTPTLADPNQCEDIDECAAGTDNCDDVCKNTAGTFTCDCNGDFFLQEDGYTCVQRTCSENKTCGELFE